MLRYVYDVQMNTSHGLCDLSHVNVDRNFAKDVSYTVI